MTVEEFAEAMRQMAEAIKASRITFMPPPIEYDEPLIVLYPQMEVACKPNAR